MTDLQRIEISGFKGIEHLEYEPSGVNLVTGRNNTGKTSLLEAIALAFDPTYVEEFGEDIDSLIHEDFEECRITVETGEETREMSFRHPTEEEAGEYFSSAITPKLVDTFRVVLEKNDELVKWPYEVEDDEINHYMNSLFSEVVQNVIDKYLDNNSTEGLQEECLAFSMNGADFQYGVIGEYGGEITQMSANTIFDEIEREFSGDNDREFRVAEVATNTPFVSQLAEGSQPGFSEEPKINDVVTFIKSKNLLSAPDFDPDEDAIKRDDLGDYIKETGLADELKTFNLDTLVFQKEGGEKYSVPYDFMGDGFKTVVGLLWELMDDEIEDQIVLLEEPENHMHPGYVRKVVYFLVELAKDEDVQLFITTHNKDFIDTFFSENLRDEEVEFLEDEFTLVRMESHSAVVEDYETARENVEDLHLDLRGI